MGKKIYVPIKHKNRINAHIVIMKQHMANMYHWSFAWYLLSEI